MDTRPVSFQGKEYKFVKVGRRGINTLAYFLLDGRAAYPTIVYLDENANRILISPGFKDANQMMMELDFVNGEYYKNVNWEEFVKEYKNR